ncbi:hypothetical protein [Micromonospora sp. DH14]|uniref:hypothetical protein n=1 Tax=Micromonospora sp. DH14 TaxID=3040120 RepID=UPI0024413FF6|nr:hypothetical protein [Micromonospora sp. DH14]MDG9675953.1 hypothetical protein [Micromonospora sp. DH14]
MSSTTLPVARDCSAAQVVPRLRRPTGGQRCHCIDPADAVTNVSAQRFARLRVPFAGERLQDADSKVELIVVIGREAREAALNHVDMAVLHWGFPRRRVRRRQFGP